MSWKKLKDYYVYTYINENQIPYYVGMGKNNRVVQKHRYVTVPPFEQIIVNDGLTQQEAWDKEVELIALYGREDLGLGSLKNLTNGGPTQKSGWKQSSIAKHKISAANTGKVRTDEHRQKYKKSKSQEHIKNIRTAVSNLWADPLYKAERIEKIKRKSFAHKGKPWSQARREAHMNKQKNKGESV